MFSAFWYVREKVKKYSLVVSPTCQVKMDFIWMTKELESTNNKKLFMW